MLGMELAQVSCHDFKPATSPRSLAIFFTLTNKVDQKQKERQHTIRKLFFSLPWGLGAGDLGKELKSWQTRIMMWIVERNKSELQVVKK